jgi:phosphoadenosine phosphosulfate reductase
MEDKILKDDLLLKQSASLTSQELLQLINDKYGKRAVFGTSFGIEDQAILHMLSLVKGLQIEIFTIDTGRLFPETINLWSRSLERYKIPIKSYHPEPSLIQSYLLANGPNAFYESITLRKECCSIRKVIPLENALKGKETWITGLRAEQSENRNNLSIVETGVVLKVNPILNWTWEQLNNFVLENNIPVNPLHNKGFVSIGCAPCTRAIKKGESFRAGRWWWENSQSKECGLHEDKKQ